MHLLDCCAASLLLRHCIPDHFCICEHTKTTDFSITQIVDVCGSSAHRFPRNTVASSIRTDNDHRVACIQKLLNIVSEAFPIIMIRFENCFYNFRCPLVRSSSWKSLVLNPFEIVRADSQESIIIFFTKCSVKFLDDFNVIHHFYQQVTSF
jgi:hypothetical protein